MIMHAKNLLPKSAGNLSDPYVKIYLTPDPTKSTKRKTKIARRSLNPTYNERFEWEITENELRKRQIRVTVWDYDVLTEMNSWVVLSLIPLTTTLPNSSLGGSL